MNFLEKLTEKILYRNVFYCDKCDVKIRMNKPQVALAHRFGGPYCYKCGKKISSSR